MLRKEGRVVEKSILYVRPTAVRGEFLLRDAKSQCIVTWEEGEYSGSNGTVAEHGRSPSVPPVRVIFPRGNIVVISRDTRRHRNHLLETKRECSRDSQTSKMRPLLNPDDDLANGGNHHHRMRGLCKQRYGSRMQRSKQIVSLMTLSVIKSCATLEKSKHTWLYTSVIPLDIRMSHHLIPRYHADRDEMGITKRCDICSPFQLIIVSMFLVIRTDDAKFLVSDCISFRPIYNMNG